MFLPLSGVLEGGAPAPQLAAALRDTLAAAAAQPPREPTRGPAAGLGGGWGAQLLGCLAADHGELDALEAMRDKRAALSLLAQGRLLNSTLEAMATRLATAAVDRCGGAGRGLGVRLRAPWGA